MPTNERTWSADSWKRGELVALAVALAVLIVWRNHHFAQYAATLVENSDETTDVYFLLKGFHRTPDLWRDGLAWWHGPWIHALTPYFRPIGSYIHWVQCYVGLRWGFVWIGYFGLVLFYGSCLLAAALAWRITRSKPATVVGAAALPFVLACNPGQPEGWLAWFPGHPDLIVGSLMLAALLCFAAWIERARRGYLLGTWLLFLIACGVKEHAYIFPAMVLAFALLRSGRVRRRDSVLQALCLFAATAALFTYRKIVVPNAPGPGFDPLAFVIRPIYFIYPVLYQPIRLGETPILTLAALLWLQGWAWLRLRRVERVRRWLSRPFAGVIAAFTLLAIAAGFGLATGTLILFADPGVAADVLSKLVRMWFVPYSLTLLVRYRQRYPTALSWILLWLAYLPIIHTVGWHYTLVGWLFRAQYWALMTQLLWIEWDRDRAWQSLRSRLPLPGPGAAVEPTAAPMA
jgi:hypothetical protein